MWTGTSVHKWEGGLLMDTRTRDKEELIDLATRKQDWNKSVVCAFKMALGPGEEC